MKILFEHSGILPIKNYGGTERIIFWHMKELVRQGHKVVLIGHQQSKVEQYGIQLIKRDCDGDWCHLIPKDVDLVHLFYTPNFDCPKPLMVTIEGNGLPKEKFHINTVFVSKKHAENHGSDQFVYNGLDFSEYPKVKRKKTYWNDFLFLAKVSWKVKNITHCIKASKFAKKNLHIAGGRKLSFNPRIKSYGMVGQAKKHEILSCVDCLLWPVRWHEPFGIAIIEAYSAGIPVIGSNYGSLKELITPEVGIICDSYNDFTNALNMKSNPFDPEKIRNYVEKNYSVEIMTNNYLLNYKRILNNKTLNNETPYYVGDRHPEELLPF